MQLYLDALALIEQASDMVEATGDTLIVAHLALPISLIRERVSQLSVDHDGD